MPRKKRKRTSPTTAKRGETAQTLEDPRSPWPIRVIRSPRRKKTASARLVKGVLEVRVPSHIGDEEFRRLLETLLRRVRRRAARVKPSDEDLEKRARALNRRYFDGQLRWASIRWVTNQEKRFGSCTPDLGTIRISHRLAKAPKWVLDYVIMHELAHLVEPNHGPRFWELVYRYPLTERARGYLMALGLEEEDEETLPPA